MLGKGTLHLTYLFNPQSSHSISVAGGPVVLVRPLPCGGQRHSHPSSGAAHLSTLQLSSCLNKSWLREGLCLSFRNSWSECPAPVLSFSVLSLPISNCALLLYVHPQYSTRSIPNRFLLTCKPDRLKESRYSAWECLSKVC